MELLVTELILDCLSQAFRGPVGFPFTEPIVSKLWREPKLY